MVTAEVVNLTQAKVMGMVNLVLTCKDTSGVTRVTRQQCYVTWDCQYMFLSQE